jgi:hypothetical protein
MLFGLLPTYCLYLLVRNQLFYSVDKRLAEVSRTFQMALSLGGFQMHLMAAVLV